MKGKEIIDQIKKMEYDMHQADKLQDYFKKHPEKSEEISEAAGLGTQASKLFVRGYVCREPAMAGTRGGRLHIVLG